MGIYSQLSRLSYRFPIKKTVVPCTQNVDTTLVDFSPARIYIAFSFSKVTVNVSIAPRVLTSINDALFSGTDTATFEVWIERHMSLVGQSWHAFVQGASAPNIIVWEVIYSDIEGKDETALSLG